MAPEPKAESTKKRPPDHGEVIAAPLFLRRAAGMREPRELDRDLRARGGESAR